MEYHTREEYRGALLEAVFTGDARGTLTYSNIHRHIGTGEFEMFVATIFRAANPVRTTVERCKMVLDRLNELYPPG